MSAEELGRVVVAGLKIVEAYVAHPIVGAVVKALRDVAEGKMSPKEAEDAFAAMIADLKENDAAADKALEERFRKP